MRVLSLFDGISCARVALGDRVTEYFASEIDPKAMWVAKKNFPDTQHIGDVREVRGFTDIDLLIGGSPCQDLSIAKKDRKGLAGNRSGLFWEYVRILRETKPRWFLLENVASMPKADRDVITAELGVEPMMIDASLVSAQSRKRLFWTNIPGVTQPTDRGILLRDILQPDAEVDESMTVQGKSFCLTASAREQRTMVKVGFIGEGEQCGQGGQAHRVYAEEGKTPTLSSFAPLIKVGHIGTTDSQTNRVYSPDGKAPTQCRGPSGGATPTLVNVGRIRKLTPVECERLQGLPDNYTEGIAKTHRYKCLGNAFHVEVIKHILSFVKTD